VQLSSFSTTFKIPVLLHKGVYLFIRLLILILGLPMLPRLDLNSWAQVILSPQPPK
jgi:hypothetical protein